MNSYISLALAAQRARDLQGAAAVQRYRQARRAAHAQPGRRQVPHGSQVPDSYEDFLCQTARSVMREPTAAGRSHGQAVR